MLEMLRQLFASEQYNVRTAADGAEGLEQMHRQAPDMVMLDLSMPKLNGPDTLREIRQSWGPIPIIIHTGFADGDLMKRALEFSPFTLLAKPSTGEQILETIRKLHRSGDTSVWKRNHFDLPKPRYQ
jgi:two-component system response regulator MprA